LQISIREAKLSLLRLTMWDKCIYFSIHGVLLILGKGAKSELMNAVPYPFQTHYQRVTSRLPATFIISDKCNPFSTTLYLSGLLGFPVGAEGVVKIVV